MSNFHDWVNRQPGDIIKADAPWAYRDTDGKVVEGKPMPMDWAVTEGTNVWTPRHVPGLDDVPFRGDGVIGWAVTEDGDRYFGTWLRHPAYLLDDAGEDVLVENLVAFEKAVLAPARTHVVVSRDVLSDLLGSAGGTASRNAKRVVADLLAESE